MKQHGLCHTKCLDGKSMLKSVRHNSGNDCQRISLSNHQSENVRGGLVLVKVGGREESAPQKERLIVG